MRFLSGQQQLLFENLRPKSFGNMNGVGRAPSPADAGTTTDLQATAAEPKAEIRERAGSVHAADALAGMIDLGDAPSCHVCGSIMVRNGSCYKCMSCGSTSGCS
jgi:ribonucleoside-diphosphate reductase alpha chain